MSSMPKGVTSLKSSRKLWSELCDKELWVLNSHVFPFLSFPYSFVLPPSLPLPPPFFFISFLSQNQRKEIWNVITNQQQTTFVTVSACSKLSIIQLTLLIGWFMHKRVTNGKSWHFSIWEIVWFTLHQPLLFPETRFKEDEHSFKIWKGHQ